MKMITRNNYELYIVDFYDGKLNKVQEEELLKFLDQNVDLKEEFELFSNDILETENVVFENKGSLKKEVNSSTEKLIAYFENDLDSTERKSIDTQLKSDVKMAQELEIIRKTRLRPDYTILFENKNSLRRTAKVIAFTKTFYRNLSIAASIILIALAYFIFRPDRKSESMIADDKKNSELPVIAPVEKNQVPSTQIADQKNEQKPKIEIVHKEKQKTIPAPEQKFANRDKVQQEKVTPSPSPVPNQEIQIEKNLAVEQKQNVVVPIIENPIASNTINKTKSNPVNNEPVDLSEYLTTAELAELGISKNLVQNKSEATSVLDYAAEKIKHFSDSREIKVFKNVNIVDEATTYAVNVGKNFSVSHTVVK